MHRMALSAARLCSAAAARRASGGGRLAPAPARLQLVRQRLPPREARGYVGVPVTAIATPFQRSGTARTTWAPQPAGAPAAPAPSGLQRLWQAYLTSLARQPLLTKAATSFFCVVIGDSIAQLIGGAPYSVLRIGRLALYSSTVGAATGHYWHRWLERNVHPEAPTSSKAVTKKLVLDQLLLSPVMTAVFFVALKCLEGRPEAIVPFLQEKYVSTVIASVAVWTPWNVVAFKWIPQDLRILAGNLAGIGWGCFMSVSCINNDPTAAAGAAPSAFPPGAVAVAAVLQEASE